MMLYVTVSGYTGTYCETDIDECASNPCRNNGICVDKINGYHCTCVNGFTGTNCQDNIDDCASNPCYNGGVCRDSLSSYTCRYGACTCVLLTSVKCLSYSELHCKVHCSCPSGFSGPRCERNNNDCANNHCLHGICVDGINDFTCRCSPGYAGRLCDRKINECEINPCQYGGTCEELPYGSGYKVRLVATFINSLLASSGRQH